MTASADAARATLVELDGRIDPLASVGNFDDLAPILADDFVYTHSTGQSQNKSEWLQGLAGLAGKRERVSSDIAVEMHDDVAVTRGNLDVIWPDGRHALDRYVRVYRLQDGQWRLISQRTLPAPDRTPAGSPP